MEDEQRGVRKMMNILEDVAKLTKSIQVTTQKELQQATQNKGGGGAKELGGELNELVMQLKIRVEELEKEQDKVKRIFTNFTPLVGSMFAQPEMIKYTNIDITISPIQEGTMLASAPNQLESQMHKPNNKESDPITEIIPSNKNNSTTASKESNLGREDRSKSNKKKRKTIVIVDESEEKTHNKRTKIAGATVNDSLNNNNDYNNNSRRNNNSDENSINSRFSKGSINYILNP